MLRDRSYRREMQRQVVDSRKKIDELYSLQVMETVPVSEDASVLARRQQEQAASPTARVLLSPRQGATAGRPQVASSPSSPPLRGRRRREKEEGVHRSCRTPRASRGDSDREDDEVVSPPLFSSSSPLSLFSLSV